MALPSPSARRSSPRRAWSGPERPALEALDEAAHEPEPILEGEPRVALAPLVGAVGSRTWPPATRARRPGRRRCQPAGRQHGVEQGQAQRGEHGRRPQVALDALHDRDQTDQLARRVQLEQVVDEVRGASTAGNRSRAQVRAASSPGSAMAAAPIVGVERRLALLRPAALVAADRAAVVALGSVGPSASPSRVQMNSSATSIRPQVAQRVANRSPIETFRLDSRRGDADMPWNAASR